MRSCRLCEICSDVIGTDLDVAVPRLVILIQAAENCRLEIAECVIDCVAWPVLLKLAAGCLLSTVCGKFVHVCWWLSPLGL